MGEVQERPPQALEPEPLLPYRPTSRRGFFSSVGLGWSLFTLGSVAGLGVMSRFLFPNVLYEPKMLYRIGTPGDYAVGVVDERFKAKGFWIFREDSGFFALSTVCTHLGCTPNWLTGDEKFKCPCHGSGFTSHGINVEGPAPRPLERFEISLADDGQIVVNKNKKFQQELGQWEMPGAYLNYSA